MIDEKAKTLGVKVTQINRTVLISTRDSHKWCCSICTVGTLVQREFERNRLKTMSIEEALRDAILTADKTYKGFAAAVTGYSEQLETSFDVDLADQVSAEPPGEAR